jgi:hypothetical protein
MRKSPKREAIATAIVAELLFSVGGAGFYPQLLRYKEQMIQAAVKALKASGR